MGGNLFDLGGEVVVVTGASGNLGPIWVDTLRDTDGCGRIYEFDLPEYDIRKWEDITRFRNVIETPGILINNAAIDNPPGTDATFFGNFASITDVNLIGAVRMCRAFIPGMIKNGGGVIINVGSIMGSIGADWRNYESGFEKPVAYNCSKAALIQLSRSITTQYGRYGIRCVTIAFGPYDGGKLKPDFLNKFLRNVPLGRTISKESFQRTLLYACCCEELAGQVVLVDGGLTAW